MNNNNNNVDLTARNMATNKPSLAGCSMAVMKSTLSAPGSSRYEYHTPPNYTHVPLR